MAGTQQVDVPVIMGPQKLAYPLFRFTESDWIVIIGLGAPTFALSQRWGFLVLLLGVAVITFVMWPQKWGRRYTMWVDAIYSWWIMNILQGVLWENPFYTGDDRLSPTGFRRVLGALFRRKHPYSYTPDRIWSPVLAELGLVHCSLGNNNSLIVCGDGSDIASLSPVEQASRISELEKAVKRIAALQRLSAELGIKVERRPADLVEHDTVTALEIHPSVVAPEVLEIMNAQLENVGKSPDRLYAEGVITKQQLRDWRLHLIDVDATRKEIQAHGTSVEMTIVVTIRRSSQLQKAAARASRIKPEDVRKERIVQLGKAMLETVSRMGVANPHILDQRGCEDYLREAWDVATLDEYRQERAAATTSEDRQVPIWHPQIGIYVTNNVAVFDRTNYAVVRITKMPKEIEPNFMDRLFTEIPRTDVRWLSRTLASEPVKGTREYAGLNFLSALADSLLDSFPGVRIGSKTVNRRKRLEKQEKSVADEGHIEYFNGYLGVAAVDPDELEVAVDILLSEVQVHDVEAERVEGASRIARAAQTAQTAIALL